MGAMVFLMPGEKAAPPAAKKASGSLTPREIVAELDKYVIGQKRAKKAVAIALRNRWRRQQLRPEMSREILPKNILMIGPTGVGKTEIARRLARLADAPFIKVEASKFTEVGYVGRDVESIVRDLTEVAVQMVREEKTLEIRDRARARTEQRLLDLLLPALPDSEAEETRAKLRTLLREGKLEDRMVEVEVADKTFPSFEIVTNQGVEEMDINVKEMLPGLFGGKKKRRKTTVGEARADPPGRGGGAARSTRARSRARRSSARSRPASSSSTRSTRSPAASPAAAGPTSRARACSATCCRSSRGPPSTRSTASSRPTTSSSSRPARSTSRSPRT